MKTVLMYGTFDLLHKTEGISTTKIKDDLGTK